MSAVASLHILAEAPDVEFRKDIYPSVTVGEGLSQIVVTVTGDAEQRRQFAADLRALADQFEAWVDERAEEVPA